MGFIFQYQSQSENRRLHKYKNKNEKNAICFVFDYYMIKFANVTFIANIAKTIREP